MKPGLTIVLATFTCLGLACTSTATPDSAADGGGPSSDSGGPEGGVATPSHPDGSSGDAGVAAHEASVPVDSGHAAHDGSAGQDGSPSVDASTPPDSSKLGDASSAGDASEPPGCGPATVPDLHVSNSGSDDPAKANGSPTCPFKTIAHAVAAAATSASPATIHLDVSLDGNVFGDACSTPPCDSTPIVIPATLGGLRLVGDTAYETSIKGGGSSVLEIHAPAVVLSYLTVMPTLLGASATSGGVGILIDAPAAPGAEGSLSNVEVKGIQGTGSSTTGAGIYLHGGSSPTIGPDTAIYYGHVGVLVDGPGAAPRFTASGTASVRIQGFDTACLQVTGAATPAPYATLVADPITGTSSTVGLLDCGAAGIEVSTGVASATPTTATNVMVTVTLANTSGSAVLVKNGGSFSATGAQLGSVSTAVEASGTATVVLDGVTLKGGGGGLLAYDSARVTATRVTASYMGPGSTGIACMGNAMLKLRTTTTLADGNGVSVSDTCAIDLGTSGDFGSNVFNGAGADRNQQAGLCYLATVAPVVVAGDTWGCGGGSAPTVSNPSSGCAVGVDVSSHVGAVQLVSPQCGP